jgi:1-aminocyclopropane-1-carboxylate deaminase/D-cysteine desulfhydrase-like pyridoxal-dependent ACC family enzyme
MKEFMEQDVQADWIVFGTSSGGTHAGLVLGQRLFGYPGKVLGISIDEPAEWLKTSVSELASDASERLGERIDFTPDEVLATDEYCQAGYGVFGEGEREAIKLFARQEGLLLDPVYTGRAAAGMIDLIRKGFFKNCLVLAHRRNARIICKEIFFLVIIGSERNMMCVSA